LDKVICQTYLVARVNKAVERSTRAGGVPMGTAPAQQVRWNSERGTEAFGTDAHRRAARERGDA